MPIIDNFNVGRMYGKVRQEIIDKMAIAGDLVVGRIKAFVPVDTGRLRDSIIKEVVEYAEEIICRIGTNLFYAFYRNNGTGLFADNGKGRKDGWYVPIAGSDNQFYHTFGMKGSQFMEKGFDNDTKREVKEILRKEIK